MILKNGSRVLAYEIGQAHAHNLLVGLVGVLVDSKAKKSPGGRFTRRFNVDLEPLVEVATLQKLLPVQQDK